MKKIIRVIRQNIDYNRNNKTSRPTIFLQYEKDGKIYLEQGSNMRLYGSSKLLTSPEGDEVHIETDNIVLLDGREIQ